MTYTRERIRKVRARYTKTRRIRLISADFLHFRARETRAILPRQVSETRPKQDERVSSSGEDVHLLPKTSRKMIRARNHRAFSICLTAVGFIMLVRSLGADNRRRSIRAREAL